MVGSQIICETTLACLLTDPCLGVSQCVSDAATWLPRVKPQLDFRPGDMVAFHAVNVLAGVYHYVGTQVVWLEVSLCCCQMMKVGWSLVLASYLFGLLAGLVRLI